MKKIIILFLSIQLLLAGCTNDFDPVLHGNLNPENFPSTEEDFTLYTLEVYKPFGSKWGYSVPGGWQGNFHSYEYGHIFMFDGPSDLISVYENGWGAFFEAVTRGDFEYFLSQGKDTSHLPKMRFVTRITMIIDSLEKADIDEATKLQLLAEAKLARAWVMYYLLHLYGPVPVILDASLVGTEAEWDVTRPSRETFVAAIESDLQFASDAANGLPDTAWTGDNYGRFTRGFAMTLLMRLYMNERDFVKAEQVGSAITSLGYGLVTEGENPYKSLFELKTQRNSELIFSITVDAESTGDEATGNINAWTYYCYPGDFPGEYQGGGWSSPHGVFMADWDFYDSFDSADKRKEMLVGSYDGTWGETRDRTNMNGAVIVKYPEDVNNPGGFQGNDIVIARYSDVLLMLAEAINENSGPTAEAIALVNQVRNRAGLEDLTAAETTDKATFNDAILRERSWELFFEGVRKMDLIRHGKWESSLQANGKQNAHQLLPIPLFGLDMGIQQNDGY
ncbi:RagB/SusD family nutrient uptake outer membrane protein [Limibacter armeniacum]|uniref:RagB/SusD family nutrient uptake outer membrane protein n=1 Tax=Limibacter armeniacum TaxID=466084 RepID=UPI002FE5DAEA